MKTRRVYFLGTLTADRIGKMSRVPAGVRAASSRLGGARWPAGTRWHHQMAGLLCWINSTTAPQPGTRINSTEAPQSSRQRLHTDQVGECWQPSFSTKRSPQG